MRLLQYLCVGVTLLGGLVNHAASLNGTDYTYMGCYYNTNWTLSGLDQMVVTKRTINNNTGCGYICYDAGFRYAGTQNGNVCMCGNAYGLLGIGVCDMPCPGFPLETCGGRSSASVYHTGKVCFSKIHDHILHELGGPDTQVIRQRVSGLVVGRQYGFQASRARCEQQCGADPSCMHYSYFTEAHPYPLWVHKCFGFTIYSEEKSQVASQGAESGRFLPCYIDDEDLEKDVGDFAGHLSRTIIFSLILIIFLGIWWHHEQRYEKA